MNSAVHVESPHPLVVCHLCPVVYGVCVLYMCQWGNPCSDTSRPAGYELCIEFCWK